MQAPDARKSSRGDDQPPSWRLLAREAPALVKLVINQFRGPALQSSAEHGRSVLVIPGFLTGDLSTMFLRRSLAASGWRAFGWRLGLNIGARADLMDRLGTRLDEVIAETEQLPVLLGWSLGGLYARELARRRSESVRAVVTLGSPFSVGPRANNAWRLYELVNRHSVDDPPLKMDWSSKPPVPTLAVWSSIDGIVAPASARGAQGEADETFEIRVPHMALGSEPGAIRQIVRILARFAEEPSA